MLKLKNPGDDIAIGTKIYDAAGDKVDFVVDMQEVVEISKAFVTPEMQAEIDAGNLIVLADDDAPDQRILAKIENIDFTATGDTLLYTVPDYANGCRVTRVLLINEAATVDVTGEADVGIGNNATFDDIVASATLTGFDTAGQTFEPTVLALQPELAAGKEISIEVDAAATGGGTEVQNVTAVLFGYVF